MPYRKKTIRSMPPQTRDLARLINQLDSVTRKLKNRLEVFASFERDSQALFTRIAHLDAEKVGGDHDA